jgi:lysophospholipase L1-like esterase
MGFLRYVALGDSFTEGVGDPDPSRPNGVRGWADRVAEVLATKEPDFRYANLAIRGRMLRQVVDEQVEPALAMRPDLVTVYAGGNDIMRPTVDLDALVELYDDAVGRLAASGARILLWTGFDASGSAVFGKLRGRTATYNELVRWVADRHGATIVDFWRLRDYRDWRMWDLDRLHMSSPGHQRMAVEVLDILRIQHDLQRPPLPPAAQLSRRAQLQADFAWARTHAAPWVQRRLTRRSSGDELGAKRPTLEPVETSTSVASEVAQAPGGDAAVSGTI